MAKKPVKHALAALTLVAAGCGGSQPPTPPPLSTFPSPPPAASPRKPVVRTPAVRFAAARDAIVKGWLADEPAFGRQVGLHEHDGRIADYSAKGIQARVARLEKARAELATFDAKALPADDALDLAILKGQVDLALFRLVDLDEWRRRPQFYDELFAVDAYVNRDYAPLADRAKALLAHEKAALAQIGNVRANLLSPMSRPVVETAAKIYAGYAEYLRGDVKKLLAGVGDAAFQDDLAKTNEALAKEAAALADHLKKVEAPKGDQSHVLGPERFKKLLAVQEGLAIPLADFKAMGEKNLAENKAAFVELRKKRVQMTRPKASELLGAATELMESSRKFVVDKGLVTIPTDDRAIVKPSPPFMRWNSAFLNEPGPLEKAPGQSAFYYITEPDPSWPAKEREEYLMPRGVLLSTTVHEVYPGHFLHGLWVKRAPTLVQKLFASYSFVEGWAHYAEQMMVDEGFGKEDPQNRMGQLSDALLRNCRMVVSLGVHTEGMTLDQAAKRFTDDCFQDKATAREQAVRATFDPGYFAYTLGKIQILELREEAKKAAGASFDLRRFHDALLAHGSPAVPLVRERVLAEVAARR
jgi:uncharacterized protein (DUF885 family)